MDKKDVIQLTSKIYRLTLLFPKKEPLRYKIREKADEILEGLVALEVINSQNGAVEKAKNCDLLCELEQDFEIISSYLEVAKWNNWASYFDVLEVQERYDSMKDNILIKNEDLEKDFEKEVIIPLVEREPEKIVSEVQNCIITQPVEKDTLDERKERILSFLREKEMVQVWEISKILPDVSKRTLRRDFAQLLRQGHIERIGEKNNTFYKLKIQII